ncbi:MAG: response regulator transcription factor [Acidobacteria bacterium]|nr:response regulator transcription factor [Acidobacteriota bacterium]
MSRILIIEDELDMIEGLRDAFAHQGFETLSATDGKSGLEQALAGQADLILLDLRLPKKDGLEVCRELRARNVHTPIIMLTARGQVTDRIAGLELGADDYITKPFSVGELIARIHAVLRRSDPGVEDGDQVRVGDVTVDFKKYTAYRDGTSLVLTDHEVKLLRLFVEHPHEVITRDRLLDEVWGYDCYPTTRTVDTFIYRLRQKIEVDPGKPEHLLTVRGAGYKFIP